MVECYYRLMFLISSCVFHSNEEKGLLSKVQFSTLKLYKPYDLPPQTIETIHFHPYGFIFISLTFKWCEQVPKIQQAPPFKIIKKIHQMLRKIGENISINGTWYIATTWQWCGGHVAVTSALVKLPKGKGKNGRFRYFKSTNQMALDLRVEKWTFELMHPTKHILSGRLRYYASSLHV